MLRLWLRDGVSIGVLIAKENGNIMTSKGVSIMELMGRNRHERRALARINNVQKIGGSMRPYERTKKGKKASR